jgi:hypothetical protein
MSSLETQALVLEIATKASQQAGQSIANNVELSGFLLKMQEQLTNQAARIHALEVQLRASLELNQARMDDSEALECRFNKHIEANKEEMDDKITVLGARLTQLDNRRDKAPLK